METIDRRDFIKGAAITGASLAAAAGAGVAQAAEQSSAKDASASSAATDGETGSGMDRYLSEAGKAWRTPVEPAAEADVTDGGTYDVVIVGGGQAGTWCARSASMNGASVVVVESQEEDSYHWIGGGVGTVNSQWARDHGAPEIDPEEFMNEVYRRNAGRSNQRMLRDYVDHSGELLDWAIADIDKDWMEANTHVYSCPLSEHAVMDPSGYKYFVGSTVFRAPSSALADWTWVKVLSHHKELAEQDGAVWVFQTHADYLEKDESGRVTSVVCTNRADGSRVRYTATKGVVLAAGDFQGNADMLRDINDEYRHMAESMDDIEVAKSVPVMLERDGSGIAMGVWAGAHVEVGPHAAMNTGQAAPDTPWGPGSPLLNQRGQRYCDECAGGTEGAGYMGCRQPQGALVAVNDADWQMTALTMPPCHGSVDYAYTTFQSSIEAMDALVPSDEPSEVPSYSGTPLVYCAETLEDLFRVIGVYDEEQQAAAVAEIEHYNECAHAGRDDEFGTDPRILRAIEKPPFYAVVGSTTSIATGLCQTTGLDVDDKMRVLDKTMWPIEGLYAIGNNAGNRFCVQYATPMGGMSLGFCLTEGMLTGTRLAKGEI